MNESSHAAGDVDQPIDEVLRDYYRSEMPKPWPGPPQSEAVASHQLGAWRLSQTRVLVGASLVALVLAYLGLAGLFPRQRPGALEPNQAPVIGHRPGIQPMP